MVVFEERPQEYVERASSFGLDLKIPRHEKKLEILYLRPLDLIGMKLCTPSAQTPARC